MIIKNVLEFRIRDKQIFVGEVHNDKSEKYTDGQNVVLPPIRFVWSDPAGNTFAALDSGTVMQIEFYKLEREKL